MKVVYVNTNILMSVWYLDWLTVIPSVCNWEKTPLQVTKVASISWNTSVEYIFIGLIKYLYVHENVYIEHYV